MGLCILCEQEPPIDNSHIISRFVFKRMKQGTPVKTLRHSSRPSKPIQDGIKRPYLCEGCEGRFSKWEHYFCKTAYDPYRNGAKELFEYDERFGLFLASLHFRYLTHMGDESGEMDAGFETLLERLKQLCLSEKYTRAHVYLYVAFLHPVESLDRGYPPGINTYWFFVSDGFASDRTLPPDTKLNISFVKLPYFATLASDVPLETVLTQSKLIEGNVIFTDGKVDCNATEDCILQFMKEEIYARVIEIGGFESNIPSSQRAKIREEIEADPDHKISERHKVYKLDRKLLREWQDMEGE